MRQHFGKTAVCRLALIVSIIAVFVTGCTAHTLREAQQAVKEGVTAEHQYNYGHLSIQDAEILSLYQKESRVNFQSANDILDTLLTSKKSELEQDGLLATAQVLKCICIWKLGHELSEFDAINAKINENNLYDEQKALLATIHQNVILNDLDRKVQALQRASFPSVPKFNAKAVDLYNSCVYNIFDGSGEAQPVLAALEEQFGKSNLAAWRIYVLESEMNAYAVYCEALSKAKPGLGINNNPRKAEIIALWQRYTNLLSGLDREAATMRRAHAQETLSKRCPGCSGELK